MILLVLDEVDQLESKDQSVLYTVFEWPALQGSKLVLVGIANSLDLTDRVLPRLQVSPNYRPACWRAGEIIAQRRVAEGESRDECSMRAEVARANAASVGLAAHLTVNGERIADWLDAAQCQDCFLPSFNHNPTTSVQAGLAMTNFDGEEPVRFNWGFIGSSDTHTARPGIGYKPFARHYMTDVSGATTEQIANLFVPQEREQPARSIALDRDWLIENVGFQITEIERQGSFFTGGGLVAAHAAQRSRDGIWGALQTRAVYATSGLRQLLWFDLINESGESIAPMGASADTDNAPVFRVRAVGVV